MDPERQRIQDDLRGLVAGDVRCDEVFLQLFASDASIYQLPPLAVVRPRNTADVAAIVKYAAEMRLPIHARGAGSGLAGESLGRGLVVDFSRHMRRILRTEAESVRVQPGVVHALLNQHLQSFGRVFGPDPANSTVTTMGSVIALDASGSYWLKYGSARRHVESLQIVLADGTVLEVGKEAVDSDNAAVAPESNGNGAAATNGKSAIGDTANDAKRNLVNRLAAILRRDANIIAAHQPKSLVNRSGYHLSDVLSENVFNVPGLLAGSEGTLALITEATVATQPLPLARSGSAVFRSTGKCSLGRS